MSYPEGTIQYEADGVVLAGNMTADQVQACLAAGVKSWLYLNPETHESCPKSAVEAASVPFESIPLPSSAALADNGLVDKLLANVGAAARPLMIQCNTATRAGIPFMLHKARSFAVVHSVISLCWFFFFFQNRMYSAKQKFLELYKKRGFLKIRWGL